VIRGDDMRIRRGLLFWGFFLIPLGAVPLLVRAGLLDPATLASGWRLWPLILVAIGIAIVVGRSRVAALGTALVALVLGVVAGGAIAGGNFWLDAVTDCDFGARSLERVDQSGRFQQPATVEFDLRCGTLDVTTGGNAGWTFVAQYHGPAPVIDAMSDRLSVRAPKDVGDQRQEWQVALAPELVRELKVTTNAAATTFDLAGASLSSVEADLNAGDLRIDAAQGSVERVNIEMNAGRIRLALGGGAVSGSLSVNAGAIDLCVPADAALRIGVNDQLTFVHNLDDSGLSQEGTTWTRAGSGGPIDLDVEGNAANFTLNPSGGCE
jgi:hypothetical protein